MAIDGGRFDLWRLDLTRKGAAPEKLLAEAEVNETATSGNMAARPISRLVVFPGGSHWVQKPRESRQWYAQVLGWIGKYTATPPPEPMVGKSGSRGG